MHVWREYICRIVLEEIFESQKAVIKSKSNKSVHFPMYLWYFTHVRRRIRPVIASQNSSKATSPHDFMATWGFCRSAALDLKVQKKQVCPFSYILGDFCPCQRKNSFSHRISEFLKSNKSPRFCGNLGLLPLRCGKKSKGNKYVHFPMYLGLFSYTHWGESLSPSGFP